MVALTMLPTTGPRITVTSEFFVPKKFQWKEPKIVFHLLIVNGKLMSQQEKKNLQLKQDKATSMISAERMWLEMNTSR